MELLRWGLVLVFACRAGSTAPTWSPMPWSTEVTFAPSGMPTPMPSAVPTRYQQFTSLLDALVLLGESECPSKHDQSMCTHIKRDSQGKAKKEVPDSDCCSNEGSCSPGYKVADPKVLDTDSICYRALAQTRTCCVKAPNTAGLIFAIILMTFICPCVCLACGMGHRAHSRGGFKPHLVSRRHQVAPERSREATIEDRLHQSHYVVQATYVVSECDDGVPVQQAFPAPATHVEAGIGPGAAAAPEDGEPAFVQGYLAEDEPGGASGLPDYGAPH